MEEKDRDLIQNYESYSGYELIAEYHKRGYSKDEVLERLRKSRVPGKPWQGSLSGIVLILIALVLLASAANASAFEFHLRSERHLVSFYRTILGTFLAANFIFLGILLLGNKERFPFKLKPLYMVVALIYSIIALGAQSIMEILVAPVVILTLVFIKENSRSILKQFDVDPSEVGAGKFDQVYHLLVNRKMLPEDIPAVLNLNAWKGGWYFVLFFLMGTLFFSRNIDAPIGEDPKLIGILTSLHGATVLSAFVMGILVAVRKKPVHKAMYITLLIFYIGDLVVTLSLFGYQVRVMLLIILTLLTAFYSWYQMRSVQKREVEQEALV